MVRVTRQLAERIADLAKLLLDDDGTDVPLQQLTELAIQLIPGSAAAGVVAATESTWVYASVPADASDLHRDQMQAGNGPLVEAIRYGEARRIDDPARSSAGRKPAGRWPG